MGCFVSFVTRYWQAYRIVYPVGAVALVADVPIGVLRVYRLCFAHHEDFDSQERCRVAIARAKSFWRFCHLFTASTLNFSSSPTLWWSCSQPLRPHCEQRHAPTAFRSHICSMPRRDIRLHSDGVSGGCSGPVANAMKARWESPGFGCIHIKRCVCPRALMLLQQGLKPRAHSILEAQC